MSNLVDSPLVQAPYEKFWDEPAQITRRELQKLFNKLGSNDAELMGMFDTVFIVTNLLCEKAGVTRKELDEFVETKKTEMAAFKEAQNKSSEDK